MLFASTRYRMTRWFDDRSAGFVKADVAFVRVDAARRDHLKDLLVGDPVATIRFPRYLASSTLERDGRTHYFADRETRRAFEKLTSAEQ